MPFTVTAVDPLYIKIPCVDRNLGSGQQDSLLVRIETDAGIVGWGESDCSPLVGLVCYVTPPSHSCIHNIASVVVGATIGTPADIVALHEKVLGTDLLDIQQAEHAYSGCDIALWDALGKYTSRPVYELLHEYFEPAGAPCVPLGKVPYASVLFEATPEETRKVAERCRTEGYSVVKFGWGPLGLDSLETDVALVAAARDGLGPDISLCVDAGTIYKRDAAAALLRANAFAAYDILFLEEPVLQEAISAYSEIVEGSPVRIAGGEGSDTVRMAEDFIENGRAEVIQIDQGRIGGLTSTYQVRQLCAKHGRVFVNHSFKSHLSIAAALHAMATDENSEVMEFPQGETELSAGLVLNPLQRDAEGLVHAPRTPGLGVEVNLELIKKLLVPLSIETGVPHAINDEPNNGTSRLYSANNVLAKL